MRIIVAGGGRVGLQTAIALDDLGHSVVVVERDPERCAAIGDEYVATVVEGDATAPGILAQAAPEDADAVAALTGHQGLNLGICLLADRLADVDTVLRVTSGRGVEAYENLADHVVFPERLGAVGAVNALTSDAGHTLGEVSPALSLQEVRVAEGAPVAGRTLGEVALPSGSVVVSDAAGDSVATADTELVPGETYLLAIETDVGEEIQRLFRG